MADVPPKFVVPAGATDCHHHIYDARHPADPAAALTPPDALIPAYRALQRRLGLSRNVLIQPSTYGTDHRCLLEAMAAFEGQARGIAVVPEDISEASLRDLHAQGVRGVRFNLRFPMGAGVHAMRGLSRRIAPLGWHVEVNGASEQFVAQAAQLSDLACPVVFDHMAMLKQPGALDHPVFDLMARLLAAGKAWVKLSGAYYGSVRGAPAYDDMAEVARALESVAPRQVVWGTNWPHPAKRPEQGPDDLLLMDLLADWFTEPVRQRVLVDNPARLYQFD